MPSSSGDVDQSVATKCLTQHILHVGMHIQFTARRSADLRHQESQTSYYPQFFLRRPPLPKPTPVGRDRIPSVKAARCFEDGELDFVFIDGEHNYEAAKADIEAWWPKVRSGGLLISHDYDRQRFPGVCRAVDEFGGEHAVEVERRGLSVWKLRKGL